jgi:hypothetical protein
VPEFIAALRQLRRPIVLIAVAILVLQTLVAGLATAHAAARPAADAAGIILCHGNGDDGTAPQGQAAHDCCTLCTAAAPVGVAPSLVVLARLDLVRNPEALKPSGGPHRLPRAIRAGPSQAPPIHS